MVHGSQQREVRAGIEARPQFFPLVLQVALDGLQGAGGPARGVALARVESRLRPIGEHRELPRQLQAPLGRLGEPGVQQQGLPRHVVPTDHPRARLLRGGDGGDALETLGGQHREAQDDHPSQRAPREERHLVDTQCVQRLQDGSRLVPRRHRGRELPLVEPQVSLGQRRGRLEAAVVHAQREALVHRARAPITGAQVVEAQQPHLLRIEHPARADDRLPPASRASRAHVSGECVHQQHRGHRGIGVRGGAPVRCPCERVQLLLRAAHDAQGVVAHGFLGQDVRPRAQPGQVLLGPPPPASRDVGCDSRSRFEQQVGQREIEDDGRWGHGRVLQGVGTQARVSACSRSARMSSRCSRPTDSRTSPSDTPVLSRSSGVSC